MQRMIFILAVLALGSAGAWFFHQRSLARAVALRHCQEAEGLNPGAEQLGTWIREAGQDPFVLAALRQDPVQRLALALKAGAQAALQPEPQGMLAAEERLKFRPLAEASVEDSAALSLALGSALAVRYPEACGKGEKNPSLRRLLADAQAYWISRRALIKIAKVSFAHDKEIFCKDRALLEKLLALQKASEAACSSGKRRTPCRPGSFKAMKAEIADLERRRSLNLEKLKKKWPSPVLSEVPCQ